MPFDFRAAAWLSVCLAACICLSPQANAQAPCNGGGTAFIPSGVACGDNAQATDENTTAVGANAYAGHELNPPGSGANATALGAGSYATGTNAIGIGNQYFPNSGAFGTDSIAIGTQSAAGDFTNGLQTTGNSAIAIGNNAKASADSGLALGKDTRANFTNSTAIGNGAETTQDNQMMFGTGLNTYFMPGLPDTPAAVGSQIVSVNSSGQLTTTKATTTADGIAVGGTFSASGLSTLSGGASVSSGLHVSGGTFTDTLEVANGTTTHGITNVGDIQTDTVHATTATVTTANIGTANVTTANVVTANATTANIGSANVTNALSVTPGASVSFGNNVIHDVAAPIAATDAANKAYVDAGLNSAFKKIDENTQGIAIAIALGGIALPEGKNFAVAANVGFYDDKEAVAAQGAIRLDNIFSLNGGVGVGVDSGSKVGGRVGIMAAW